MPENNDESAKAAIGVVDAMARAFWTFVRNGAAFHAELGAKAKKVADAALEGVKSASNDKA